MQQVEKLDIFYLFLIYYLFCRHKLTNAGNVKLTTYATVNISIWRCVIFDEKCRKSIDSSSLQDNSHTYLNLLIEFLKTKVQLDYISEKNIPFCFLA